MFSAFWARQAWTFARQHTVERLPELEVAWPDHFDNTVGIGPVARPLFHKDKRTGIMLPYKGKPGDVEPGSRVGVEAHITAVAFGTTKKARQFWLQQITDGLIPRDLFDRYCEGTIVPRAAERMALHQRFWKVPYHFVGLLNGDVLYNNLTSKYTYHGNGGNRLLLGVALEGSYPGLEANRKPKHNGYDEHTILTGRAALELGVRVGRLDGHNIQYLYAHRQYSAGRLGDPGEGWWKEIGIPVARELDLQTNCDFKHGSGNPIPREWDENGPVDYRGNVL